MMTALGSLTNQSSFDDVARAIVEESQRRGYTRDESIACVSTGIQESGLRPAIVDSTGHVGIYQQDGGYPGRNNAATQITGFLDRLDAKRHSAGASTDIWRNIFWLQQRPGEKSADAAYANGRQAYLTEIRSHITQATQLYDRLATGVPVLKADYQEYPKWSPSWGPRNGTKVDLFLIHTQEGGGGDHAADDLAVFLEDPANQVSYHYCVSTASDGGTTVVDVVDTDYESWSVLSANSRSINLCFAGSRAAWTRDQWMGQAHAIDVAAYLAVQDCQKYGIKIAVVPPPYTSTPGISDHAYVTKVLKDGTHTDVGPGFPWDVFAAAVAKYAGTAPVVTSTPPSTPTPALPWPKSATDRELLEYIAAQLGPGDDAWASKGMTLRDKLWSLTAARAARKPKATS